MTHAPLTIRTLELTRCPLCDCGEVKRELVSRDFESGSGRFDVAGCGACGLRFTTPRPVEEDIPRLYEQRSTSDFPRPSRLAAWLRSLHMRRQIRSVLRWRKDAPFRALDYGCGDGTFAAEIARFPGCTEAVAADFHAAAPPAIASNPRVRYTGYEVLAKERRGFDVVFLRHVLEHQLDPRAFLRELAAYARPGGILSIEVPSYDSVWRRVFGGSYAGLYVPRHLYHFEARSLRAVCAPMEILSLRRSHTPTVGRSLGYRLGLPLSNLGLADLALFPLQMAVDAAVRKSSALCLVAAVAGDE